MIRKTTLPINLLLIEDAGYHLLIKARVNGKVASLLIDTGASKTVFDKGRVLKFISESSFTTLNKLSTGLGTAKMKTHSAVLKKLQLGKLTLPEFETIIIDLSHVNQAYENLELPEIDGVLGSDLMLKYNGVIDYKKEKTFTQLEEMMHDAQCTMHDARLRMYGISEAAFARRR